MHELLLDEICNDRNHRDQRAKIDFLKSLREPTRRLWECYRKGAVGAQYHQREVQESYLLRYYPAYAQIFPEIAGRLAAGGRKIIGGKYQLNAVFFGGGPAPELFGLIRYLRDSGHGSVKVRATLIDSAPGKWMDGRRVSIRGVLSRDYPGGFDAISAIPADMASEQLLQRDARIAAALQQADLIVFQNCLNEIAPENVPAALGNIRNILASQRDTATTIFIQSSANSKMSAPIIDEIADWARQQHQLEIFGRPDAEPGALWDRPCEIDCRPLNDSMPDLLTEHLLNRDSGFIPASRYYCRWLAVGKLLDDLDEIAF